MSPANACQSAIILAAGLGSRLKSLTATTPKCLLDVGGETLLGRSVKNLHERGVSKLTVVGGYRFEMIREALRPFASTLAIDMLPNTLYDSTGSAHSLLLGLQEHGEPTLVLESDILYHGECIDVARRAGVSSIVAAPISGSGDEVFLLGDSDGRLVNLGKSVASDTSLTSWGEFAGISFLSAATVASYVSALANKPESQRHYEEVFVDLIPQEEFRIVQTSHPWTEVDTAADLDRARSYVLPGLNL